MNNMQAAHLPPGARVRRKKPLDDPTGQIPRAVYVVERVEPKTHPNGSVTIHAGGHAFKAWEVERVMEWSGAA